jgi:hypothetical protein
LVSFDDPSSVGGLNAARMVCAGVPQQLASSASASIRSPSVLTLAVCVPATLSRLSIQR